MIHPDLRFLIVVTNFWNLSVKIKTLYLFSAFLKSILANFMYLQDLLLGANHTPDWVGEQAYLVLIHVEVSNQLV